MATEQTILELISQVDEFLEMHEIFDDRDFDLALSKIVRIISNPDINPASATTAIIHLQGLSSKFYIQASYMKNVSKPKPGSEEYQKKNMFYAMATALDNLVAALKYAVR
jgi:hypothetical protein